MYTYGVQPNTVVFNSMINVFAAAGDLKGAERYYHLMARVGVEPDVQTYNSLLHACAEKADVIRGARYISPVEHRGVSLKGSYTRTRKAISVRVIRGARYIFPVKHILPVEHRVLKCVLYHVGSKLCKYVCGGMCGALSV